MTAMNNMGGVTLPKNVPLYGFRPHFELQSNTYPQVPSLGLMVVEIGFSVRAGMATLPCAGCGPELYELVGSFFFA